MSYKYSRYISRLVSRPWAIEREKFDEIYELIQLRASGHKLSDEEIVERFGMEASAGDSRQMADGIISVIPVHGTIAYRADSFSASSGGTSAELIGKCLKRASADRGVSTIVLDFETPGGSVEGIPELAADIAKAAQVKPVIAFVNALAASAGYWLATQATEIVSTPSGRVGSIGVFLLSMDRSERMAKEGDKIEAVSAGKYKLEGAPWLPLSTEARAFMQGEVDKMYREFLSAVATGRTKARRRSVTIADVEKKYAEGRVYDVGDALAVGMIDRVATFDELIDGLAGRGTAQASRPRRVASRVTPEVVAASAQSASVVAAVTDKRADDTVEDAVVDGCPECDPGCPCEEIECSADCQNCSKECACYKAKMAQAETARQAVLAEQDAAAILVALAE